MLAVAVAVVILPVVGFDITASIVSTASILSSSNTVTTMV